MTILEAVAGSYGVTVADLRGRASTAALGEARRVAARMLHEDGGLSWQEVCGELDRVYGGWMIDQANRAPLAGLREARKAYWGGQAGPAVNTFWGPRGPG